MASSIAAMPASGTWRSPGVIASLMIGLALIETFASLAHLLPVADWAQLFAASHSDDLRFVVVRYGFLPRLCVSLISGAALAQAGLLFQQVLRNPVAEPTTLGVVAGANLALTVISLWFPSLLAFGKTSVAMAGALAAIGLVLIIAYRRALSPLSLILAGLVVTLCSGAFAAILTRFFNDGLSSIFIWQSGALNQNDWSHVHYLLPRVAGCFVLAALAVRPLAVLDLGDDTARNLGVPLKFARIGTLVVASLLSAVVVSAVGVIGFIGLAAPALARLCGARTLASRLFWVPVFGACLLWIADQTVQLIAPLWVEIPTGVATALLGAPLLLWLLRNLKEVTPVAEMETFSPPQMVGRSFVVPVVMAVLLGVLVWAALYLNRSLTGWHLLTRDSLKALLPLRVPRVFGALAAGAMLSAAGVLMQKLSANPMASPELLGISSGASVGMIALLLTVSQPDRSLQLLAASAGAFATLIAMFAIGRKSSYSAERLVLGGVALATVFSGIVSLLTASGDRRLIMLNSWLAGSTYYVDAATATAAVVVALVGLAIVPFVARPLGLLNLGEQAAMSLGLNVERSRQCLLLLTAVLTAGATLVVGPVSFVGLMGPHIARFLGFRKTLPSIFGAALTGALLLGLADWLGRNVLFPSQVPAGLFTTVVGGPYFLYLMHRRRN